MKWLLSIMTLSASCSALAWQPLFTCSGTNGFARVDVKILQEASSDRFWIEYHNNEQHSEIQSEEVFRSEEGWHDQRLKQRFNLVIDFYPNSEGLYPAFFEEIYLFKKNVETELLCKRAR